MSKLNFLKICQYVHQNSCIFCHFYIDKAGLPILFIMSKNRSYFHVFSIDIFVSVLFISIVIFTISLFSLTLSLVFSFFFSDFLHGRLHCLSGVFHVSWDRTFHYKLSSQNFNCALRFCFCFHLSKGIF